LVNKPLHLLKRYAASLVDSLSDRCTCLPCTLVSNKPRDTLRCGQCKRFWFRFGCRGTGARCPTTCKQVNEHLNSGTGSAPEGSCFACTFEDGLVNVIATLDKVLCDTCGGFLCGFFTASA
jgi:hypothetical protein